MDIAIMFTHTLTVYYLFIYIYTNFINNNNPAFLDVLGISWFKVTS